MSIKYMKRALSLIVACILLFQLSAFAQNETEEFAISGNSVTGKRSSDVTVTVALKNNPGFTYLKLGIEYDEDTFSLKEVKNGKLMEDINSERFYVWSADEDCKEDGTLVSFKFGISGNAVYKSYPVKITCYECSNYDEQDVEVTVTDAEITVKKASSGGGGGGGGGGAASKTSSPKSNIPEGVIVKGTEIILESEDGATIYYTIDGSTPSKDGPVYIKPIAITENTTIKAYAVKDKKLSSNTVTIKYTVRDANIALKEKVEGIPYMRNRFEGVFAPDEAGTRYEIIEALAILFDIEKTGKKCEFADVDKKYKENVELFFGADIIAGYPDGTFGGEKGITRAEFVKILYVMLKLEDAQSSDETFSDINGHWGEKYIKGFVKEGYISGYPDGTFKPDNNITRAEIVTIINRIIKAEAKDTLTANDVSDKHWAYEEIKKAALEN